MSFEGYIDFINYKTIKGWAYCSEMQDEAIGIDIYESDRLVASDIKANIYRSDLEECNKGNGKHGFEFIFKESHLKLSNVEVKFTGTDIKLVKTYTNFFQVREKLSEEFINGNGIEIGALHQPLWVKNGVKVRYVDKLSNEDLKKTYHELGEIYFANVDLIDNGDSLKEVKDTSIDFIICNHVLEHFENPIKAIKNHILKLRSGGIIYYAIPDKRYTFDSNRNLTTFEHLLTDYIIGTEESRYDHYKEWVEKCERIKDSIDVEKTIRKLISEDYSIHFHVWDSSTLLTSFLKIQKYMQSSFEIECFQRNFGENIIILRKK